MRRIDTSTKAVDLFGVGKHGFRNGDPALAILATKLNAEFFNSLQEEVASLIEASGQTLNPADNTQLAKAMPVHGQCRLSFVSATTIVLAPHDGNCLIINGLMMRVPAGGVSISNTGLAASTLYNVYAFMNAGAMTLELSTTVHASGANGVEIKSGAPTRTLVGMVYTNGASQFVDSTTQRFVRSWFNSSNIGLIAVASGFAFTNNTPNELSASLRLQFLAFAGETITAIADGYGSVNAVNGYITFHIYLDGNGFGAPLSATSSTVGAHNALVSSGEATNGLDVLRTVTVYGNVSTGTAAIGAGMQTKVLLGARS